jgi:hypothetical protein
MSEKIDSFNINYSPDIPGGGATAGDKDKGALTPEQIQQLLENQEPMRLSLFDKIRSKVVEFDRAKDKTRELEVLKELEDSRGELVKSILDTNLELVEKNLNHENTYPYQSGHGESYLRNIVNTTEEFSLLDVKKDETKAILKMMSLDAKWGMALFENQEGIAHRVQFYYAGADKIKYSMTRQKKCLDMENVHLQYSGSEDLRLSQDEKDKLKFKITNPKTKTEEEVKFDGVRERAIGYQDSARFWIKAVGAVARWDYEKGSNGQKLMPNHPCMREDLGPEMVKKLFTASDKKIFYQIDGRGNVTFNKSGDPKSDPNFPEDILHFFTMDDTPENRRKYNSLMFALMETNAYQKLKELSQRPADENSRNAINELIDTVKTRAEDYLKNYSKPKFNDNKLKEVVLKSEITHFQATGAVAPLSPYREYKERRDSSGNSLGLQRITSMGPLSTQGDDWSPYYHFYHDMYYDVIARKRSSFELPTISNFRERYMELQPEEKPDISLEEARKVDPNIERVFKLCLSDSPEAKRWRQENRLDIDETTRKVALSLLYFIMTPYVATNNVNARDAGYLSRYRDPLPGKKPNDEIYKFILRPTFIPQIFRSVNLYEVMYPDEERDESELPRTAWQMECGGVDPSEIDFLSVPLQIDDYNQTSQHMAGRLLNLKTEVFDKEHDDDFQSFFKNPGGVKEIIKRIGLGWRGEQWFYFDTDTKKWEKVPKETREIILAAEFMALGLNMNEGIVASGYRTARRENTLGIISSWINMDEYMPPEKNTVKNYNSGIANLTFLQLYLLDRMGLDYAEQEDRDISKVKMHTVKEHFGALNK